MLSKCSHIFVSNIIHIWKIFVNKLFKILTTLPDLGVKTIININLPFEPQTAIVSGLLDLCSSRRQALPAWSRMTDSSFRIIASRVSSSEQPGWAWRRPSSRSEMYSSHLEYLEGDYLMGKGYSQGSVTRWPKLLQKV